MFDPPIFIRFPDSFSMHFYLTVSSAGGISSTIKISPRSYTMSSRTKCRIDFLTLLKLPSLLFHNNTVYLYEYFFN